jgi:CheY-like chemotaxis protein
LGNRKPASGLGKHLIFKASDDPDFHTCIVPLFYAIQFFPYVLQQQFRRLLIQVTTSFKGTSLPTPYESLLRKIRPVAARPLILCIEDDELYLTLRKKVLEQNGFDIIGVTKTADALKTLREAPVCATISDHMLQGTTGLELAKEMKKVRPDVPIILFSGTVPPSMSAVDVYVNKGEPMAEFLRIVRDVVQRYSS